MATRDQAQALYAAYFARPADAGGLEHWTNGLGLSTPLELIADGFAVTDEYRETVLSKSLEEIIDGFYFNLFGRNSEKEGRDFWVTTIQDGLTTTQQAGLVIGQAAVVSPGNSDHEAIMAKILASNLFTDETGKTQQGLLAYQGQKAIDAGIDFLRPVISQSTIPSITEAAAVIEELSSESVLGDVAFSLSSLSDVVDALGFSRINNPIVIESGSNFRLDSFFQQVDGNEETFNATDQLLDQSTEDDDVMQLKGITQTLAGAEIANIEFLFVELNEFGRSGGRNVLFAPNQGAIFRNLDFIEISGTLAPLRITNNETQLYLDLTGTGASEIELTRLTSDGLNESTFVVADNVATNYQDSQLNDTFMGGAAADTVTFTRSANSFTNAGIGNDVVNHLGGSSRVVIAGSDLVTVNATSDQFSLFQAFGTEVSANINASSSTSAVNLTGGSANDVLIGGVGQDFLAGGLGQDVLTGGDGIDTFAAGISGIASAGSTGLSNLFEDGDTWFQTYDSVTDFELGEKIDISQGEGDLRIVASPGIAFSPNTNYAVRGDFITSTGQFKASFLGGNDVLVFRSGGFGDKTVAANLGTEGLVLKGFGADIFGLLEPAIYAPNPSALV